MAKLLFKQGTILFAGGFPEHVEEAKEYVRKNGYSKEDVRVFKKTEQYTPAGASEPIEIISVLVETLRPIAIECGVVDCPYHSPTQQTRKEEP
jgi:hypothetical protein